MFIFFFPYKLGTCLIPGGYIFFFSVYTLQYLDIDVLAKKISNIYTSTLLSDRT